MHVAQGNWEKSELTKAMIDTASTASNPNNMRIHAQGMKTIITDPGSVKSMDAGWTNAQTDKRSPPKAMSSSTWVIPSRYVALVY